MLTLGFANHYFTLWNVWEGETFDPVHRVTYIVTHYVYQQNLSMNEAEARAKIQARVGEEGTYDVDLDLRGQFGRYFTKRRIANLSDYIFSFGLLLGQDIREADDLWQLRRAMLQEASKRRRVWARRRLIELGALVRYTNERMERVFLPGITGQVKAFNRFGDTSELKPEFYNEWGDIKEELYEERLFTYKYCTPKQRDFLVARKRQTEMSGHFYTPGERVALKIKQTGGFSFDTAYGTTYIRIYETEDGKIVKYMGGCPPDISTEEFQTVKATIKHDEYKGLKETKLQRIKI